MRLSATLFGGLAIVLITVNVMIVRKERLIETGEVLYLQLAPVDPRSLIQGDYMELDLAVSARLSESELPGRRGMIVVRMDADRVGHFVRVHADGQPLADNERLLRYRMERGRARVGPNAFFFQEGHAERYENARYGEFRLGNEGECILVGLCDDERRRLDCRNGRP